MHRVHADVMRLLQDHRRSTRAAELRHRRTEVCNKHAALHAALAERIRAEDRHWLYIQLLDRWLYQDVWNDPAWNPVVSENAARTA